MKNKITVALRIKPDALRSLDKMAKASERNRSEFLSSILEAHVQSNTLCVKCSEPINVETQETLRMMNEIATNVRGASAELALNVAAMKVQKARMDGAPVAYCAGVEGTAADIADALREKRS